MLKELYVSITELAPLFGVTVREMGAILKQIGLRTADGTPIGAAFERGLVERSPSGRNGGYYYKWNREKTLAALAEAGHVPVIQKVMTAQPGRMIGPFEHRFSAGAYEIVNNDGITVACTSTEVTAVHIVALLNSN